MHTNPDISIVYFFEKTLTGVITNITYVYRRSYYIIIQKKKDIYTFKVYKNYNKLTYLITLMIFFYYNAI